MATPYLETQVLLWSAGISGSTLAAVASVLAATIAAIAAIVTSRSSSRAQVKSAQYTSRADIEAGAFTRAEGIYKNLIDEQEDQIAGLREELAAEKRERKTETADLRRRLNQVQHDLDAARATIRALRGSLTTEEPEAT